MVENAVDKDRAKADESYRAVTFDLQAVLTTPFAGDAQIYYKGKLSVCHFTIYDHSSANGQYYLWDDTEGAGVHMILHPLFCLTCTTCHTRFATSELFRHM